VGLKNVTTGDTICSDKAADPVGVDQFAAPVISVAGRAKTKSDQEKMGVALGRLAQEDRRLRLQRTRIRTDHHQRHGRVASGNHH